jgi:hypothetical protein
MVCHDDAGKFMFDWRKVALPMRDPFIRLILMALANCFSYAEWGRSVPL